MVGRILLGFAGLLYFVFAIQNDGNVLHAGLTTLFIWSLVLGWWLAAYRVEDPEGFRDLMRVVSAVAWAILAMEAVDRYYEHRIEAAHEHARHDYQAAHWGESEVGRHRR